MRGLYPEIDPFAVHRLDVGGGHVLYVEEVGHPDGIPAVFLHGGPGSGCNAGHRRYFDPARYRVVLFDQRGAGRSTPAGAIAQNTTQHLLHDLETIRESLGIARWLVFGGSWGATLALLHAQAAPDRVLGLILRGTFLARPCDLDWFVGERGARLVYPDAWAPFARAVPAGPASLVERASRALSGSNAALRAAVATAWADYAGAVVTLSLPDEVIAAETTPRADPAPLVAKAAIEMHYAAAGYFLRENQVLDDMHLVPKVPTRIIHGRRDLTCLPAAGFAVAAALPHATLQVVREAGHLASEPGNVDALVRATDLFPAGA
jgi:proline iminopeptidase